MLFGDLIGHWDKRNAKALEYMDPGKLDRELVDDGLITTDDFRDFTLANAVRLWGAAKAPAAV